MTQLSTPGRASYRLRHHAGYVILSIFGLVVLVSCALLVVSPAHAEPGPDQSITPPGLISSTTAGPPTGSPADPGPIPGLGPARQAVGRIVDGVIGDVGGGVLDVALGPISTSLQLGLAGIINELGDFIDETTKPHSMDSSFLSRDGPYQRIASFSSALLVGFIFLGVAYGLLTGAAGQVMLRLLRDAPLAVLAIVGFPWIVSQLVELSGLLSTTILPTGDTAKELLTTQLLETLRGIGTANIVPSILIGLLTFVATLLVYLELVVRVILLQLVEALAPLSFAPMVWAPARSAAHKVAELTVAIVLAEPAIFLGLRIGLDFLHDHATSSPFDAGAWGRLLLGVAVVCLTAFSPWVIWRLLPHAEGMVLAQGLAHSPGRAAMTGMQTTYFAAALGSILTRGSRAPLPTGGPVASAGRATGLGPPRSLPSPATNQGRANARPPAGNQPQNRSGGDGPPPSGSPGAGGPTSPSHPGPTANGPPQPTPANAPQSDHPSANRPTHRGPSGADSRSAPSPSQSSAPQPSTSPGRSTSKGAAPGWSRRRPSQ